MQEGKKLDFETFIVAFMHSLHHRDKLKELVDALLNFEVFISSQDMSLSFKILEKAQEMKLYEHEEGQRLIKAIQL